MKLTTEQKLVKLAVRHSEISSEIAINKYSMNKEIAACTGIYDDNKMDSEYDTCLAMAYSCVKESRENYRNVELYLCGIMDFDEELSMYGCPHCNASRKLKKHIGKLKQERGRIHSALTNIGKTLLPLY